MMFAILETAVSYCILPERLYIVKSADIFLIRKKILYNNKESIEEVNKHGNC